MDYKRLLGAVSAALMLVIVILILARGAGAASKYKTLHRFSGGKDGAAPSGLIFDQAGNLYGTASGGGIYADGAVFKLTPNAAGSWAERVLYSFTGGKDGVSPSGGLIFDGAGNLYGTTFSGGGGACNNFSGCGTVFKLTSNQDGSWTESVLHSFFSCNCDDGVYPPGGIVFGQDGNLYGTTEFGGASNAGTVFELTPNTDGSWTESLLYSFCPVAGCGDGYTPYAGLIFDPAGNLYGTTIIGGAYNGGAVFELTPKGGGVWAEKALHSFGDGGDGIEPYVGLVFDATGNLYGATGAANGGVFKLAPNADGTWTESMLHFFTGRDGFFPLGGLTLDAARNLYGTTSQGGDVGHCNYDRGCGVVFELAPNPKGGWHERVLHTFFDHPGARPSGDVIFDADGNLYGTTSGDGTTTHGSVFEITP